MKQLDIDLAAIDLTEKFLRIESSGEEILLDRIRAEVAGGDSRPLDEVLDELGSDFREQPGEFGLDQAATLLLPLVLPALQAFAKIFAKKFVEKGAEKVAESSYSTLRDSVVQRFSHAGKSDEVWTDLEASFARRAKELKLPEASYRDLLASVRDKPSLLL